MSLLTALLGMLSCASCSSVTNLKVDDFDVKAADPAVFLVDVRTPDEYAEGHLRGAANIDWQAPDFLEQVASACPKETPVAVYCRTGRRSAEAAKALDKAGYAVTNLSSPVTTVTVSSVKSGEVWINEISYERLIQTNPFA